MFDDIISDMISDKNLHPVDTELFVTGHKLNISLAFVSQFCFPVPEDVRLNTTHFFIMNIQKKARELTNCH